MRCTDGHPRCWPSRVITTALDYEHSSSFSVSVGRDPKPQKKDTTGGQELTADAAAEAGAPDSLKAQRVLTGSLSASFSQFSENATSVGASITYAHQERTTYRAEFDSDSWDGLTLDPAFVTAVAALPADYDADSYATFINNHGTHVIAAVTMGGRAFLYQRVSTAQVSHMMSKDIDIAAGASSTLGMLVDKVGFSGSDKDATGYQKATAITKADVNYVGGIDGPDGWDTWAGTVDTNPAPIGVRLTSLDDFPVPALIHDGLLDAPGLAARRANPGMGGAGQLVASVRAQGLRSQHTRHRPQ